VKRLTIEFIPSSKEVDLTIPIPKPASEYTPKWYKDIPMFLGDDGPVFDASETASNITVRGCGPFGDTFKMGWIQESWGDIYIKPDPTNPDMPEHHFRRPMMGKARDRAAFTIPAHFYPVEFVLYTPWMAKLPEGYSMLVTSPMNHMELPFFVPSGIIDADKFFHTRFGNLPFYVYKGFKGLIPMGTPMFQMIPIKRDAWDRTSTTWDENEVMSRHALMGSQFWGIYRHKFRQKKDYR
jgi:hypothetical protein